MTKTTFLVLFQSLECILASDYLYTSEIGDEHHSEGVMLTTDISDTVNEYEKKQINNDCAITIIIGVF